MAIGVRQSKGRCPTRRLRTRFAQERCAAKVTNSLHGGQHAKLLMDTAHVDCLSTCFDFFFVKCLQSVFGLLCEIGNMIFFHFSFLFKPFYPQVFW